MSQASHELAFGAPHDLTCEGCSSQLFKWHLNKAVDLVVLTGEGHELRTLDLTPARVALELGASGVEFCFFVVGHKISATFDGEALKLATRSCKIFSCTRPNLR